MFGSSNLICGEKEISDVSECLKAGWLAPGSKAAQLEKELAEYSGLCWGLMVNSRKSALFLASIACGIKKDQNILISTNPKDFIEAIIQQINAKEVKDSNQQFDAVYSCEYDLDLSKLSDLTNKIIIEDFGFNVKKANQNTTAAIVTFPNLCSVILFKNEKDYQSAIKMRDWGRAGTQDEDIKGRYADFVLANVRYDWKFVFNELGFNFKSCEMSATLALDFFHKQIGK